MKVKLFKSFGSDSAKLLEVRFEKPEKLTRACARLGLHVITNRMELIGGKMFLTPNK